MLDLLAGVYSLTSFSVILIQFLFWTDAPQQVMRMLFRNILTEPFCIPTCFINLFTIVNHLVQIFVLLIQFYRPYCLK